MKYSHFKYFFLKNIETGRSFYRGDVRWGDPGGTPCSSSTGGAGEGGGILAPHQSIRRGTNICNKNIIDHGKEEPILILLDLLLGNSYV